MKNVFFIGSVILLLISCSFLCICGKTVEKVNIEEHSINNKILSDSEGSCSIFANDWWPMFRHDPAHSGYSTSYGPETNSISWVYNTGSWIRSSPAVVDGKVYFANYNSDMVCIDMETGNLIWKTNIGYQWLFSSPAVADGKVYIGSDDDHVYCLNAYTGELIWKFHTTDIRRVDSSPAVLDGKVFIGSNDGNLYCINADSGEKIWNFDLGDNVYSSPAVADGKVYVGASNGMFYCLNVDTKEEVWGENFFDDVESSPTVAYGKVYVGTNDGKFYCFDANSGDKIWDYQIGDLHYSSPSVTDGKVYIGKGSCVHCLNADTGDLLWKTKVDSGGCYSPAVVDGKVYIGSENINCGHLSCLNANTGEKIWDYTTGGWVWSSPAVVDGRAYIGCCDGRLYCFGESDSENQPPNIPIITGPANVIKDREYEYTFTLTDPDGDDLYVYIDWGVSYGWLPFWNGPYKSGKELTISRSWDEEATYTIKARVRDSSYAESDWGKLDVNVPKVKTINPPFLKIFKDNLILFNLLQLLIQKLKQ